MSNVVQFVPKAGLQARENLAAFVALCRSELTVFGSALCFDEDVWEVTGWLSSKGINHAIRLRFSNWESSAEKSGFKPMAEPFCSFAKAFVRYQQAWRPRKNYSNCLSALRALEVALEQTTGTRCPTNISPVALNRAAQILGESLAVSTAHNTGGELEALFRFACQHALVVAPTNWKSSLPAPSHSRIRVGKTFDDIRQKKMPSPAAFYALGDIFQTATEPADVLVAAVSALLCSAPSRIAEVVLLPNDCEVFQKDSSSGTDTLGVRWRPAKGARPMVKWVTTPMRDIIVEALQKLRDLSAPARPLVKWYEEHPTQLYLLPELEHLRGKAELTMREVSSIVFEDEREYHAAQPHQWCKSNAVKTVRRGRDALCSFADVEAAVLATLPAGFPVLESESGLRYSDALMVVRKTELDPHKSTYRCMFQPVEQADIGSRLGRRIELSIFEKFDFKEDDGSPIRVTTHQFRHYLNTLAQAGNLGQLDVAKWSGRANVHQNSAYNHLSDRDATSKLRLALAGDAAAVGPIARLHEVALIPRDEFARLRVPTAHTTEFGYCVHDYAMLPCQSFQDCINCNEHTCIKGEDVREANIRRSRDETRLLLDRTREAVADGEYGADRWWAHQTLTLQRLDGLCGILDDPAVPKGAVIRLADVSVVSPIARAEQIRALRGVESVPALPAPKAASHQDEV